MEICRLMQAILKKDTGSYQKVWYSTPKAIVKAEGQNESKRKEELKNKKLCKSIMIYRAFLQAA